MECFYFFFFKQKTAYEMRISDWSSDVCSSDLQSHLLVLLTAGANSAERPVARAAGFFAGCAHAQGNETVPPAINPCSMQRNANAEEHPWRSRRICGFEESEINRRRSEERRVGNAWVSKGRARGSTDHKKKK